MPYLRYFVPMASQSASSIRSPGQILRDARRRAGISQQSLAARASTTQSAISRIEADRVSPSTATLGSLLSLMGETLTMDSEPVDFGIDRGLLRSNLRLSPEDRLRRGIAFAATARRNRGVAVGSW